MSDIEKLLPLKPRTFHILLAIRETARNGYQIMAAVEQNSRGRVRIGPGTLYEALQRLAGQKLIELVTDESVDRPDGRGQRYYRITPLGSRVLDEESDRLAADLELVRSTQSGG